MNILGINSRFHDSSACLVKDGEPVFAIAEERLSRTKFDGNFPTRSVQACLEYGGIRSEDLDYVCFGWPKPWREFYHDLRSLMSVRKPLFGIASSTNTYLNRSWQRGGLRTFNRYFGGNKTKVLHVDHHLAHAVSAYSCSGFQEATVVIVDGRGAWEATSVWHGRDGRLERVAVIQWPNSLGLMYLQFTRFLGFQYGDEWKIMGLAPYGKPGTSIKQFVNFDDEPYRVNANLLLDWSWRDFSEMEKLLGVRQLTESALDDRSKNIAYAVQDACERAMLNVVQWAVGKTKCRTLCMAGGVALNSKANGKILRSGLVDDIFIQPAAHDEGTAIGAALTAHLDSDGQLPINKMRHVYLGSEDHHIRNTLDTYKLRYTRLSNPARDVAEMLSDGKMIGYFQDRMEFGPRALGNRSILADPRDPDMKDKVNNAVKFREEWRPFAPSILAEAAPSYLEHCYDSPFMNLTFNVNTDKRDTVSAVTHVDTSTRPQTVDKEVNPRYWDLIKEFENLTGVPVVMNTSFNLKGEPIVCSSTDAVRTFYSSGLDALVIGEYLVVK